MNRLGHVKSVLLDPRDVDLNDRTYLIPCFQDMEPLVASIKRVGIVNPPLVEQSPNNVLRPILGRRRILGAKSIGLTAIRANVLTEPIAEADGFLLSFWDNIGHRTFDTATTAVVVRRLLELLPREQAANDFLPLLGIPPKGPAIQRMQTLGTLEDTVLQALAKGSILAKTALILADLTPEDRCALLDLVKGLGLNANKSAEVVSHLADLSVLHGRAVRDFLDSPEAQAMFRSEDLTVTERAARFRILVRSWKYPELVEKERQFEEWLDKQPRLDRVTVQPTQAFEDEKCTIRITARSRSEAKEILAGLSAAASKVTCTTE